MLRCLDALLALDYPNYSVVVVDNCSSDGTAEACRERAARSAVNVEVLRLEGTVGHVRNRAVEHVDADVVAFTDSDCLPQRDWLRAGVVPFIEDPKVGIVCGRTLPEVPVDGARWPATIEVSGFSWRFHACNLLLRRDALLESDGGFDETVGHFWEDTAAGFAILRAGWEAGYAHDALVLHDVTFPGYSWHLRRALKQAHIGPVVARYPEIRSKLFWLHVFQRPRSALFVGFLAGLLLARRHRWALLLAVPYVVHRFPRSPDLRAPQYFAELVAFDGANVASGVVGGLRHGELVV
jgi:cellulose synthase/poly-beta-1,6-N-acetylglucosamine synthase-like glycosyltransferase